MKNQLFPEKDNLKEALSMFKEHVLLQPFDARNRKDNEIKRILNVFEEEEEEKIPKEKFIDELNKVKYALEELSELEKEWFRCV